MAVNLSSSKYLPCFVDMETEGGLTLSEVDNAESYRVKVIITGAAIILQRFVSRLGFGKCRGRRL
ncbi:hypothetical protein ACP70R_022204 [Stipagrostis hirtigluma subsp. patula]